MEKSWIRIHPEDQVGVALRDMHSGEVMDGVVLTEDIPAGHKAALTAVRAGEFVKKYGCSIGRAVQDIAPGQWVHSHNLATALDEAGEYVYHPGEPEMLRSQGEFTFMGYLRPNGQAGIRNEVWILPTVGCVNHTAQRIADAARVRFADRVDGVWAFTHPYGCSQLGADLEQTQKTLAALAHHPNAGVVVLLGLGCENNSLEAMKPYLGDCSGLRLAMINCQDEEDEEAAALEALEKLTAQAAQDQRVPLPADKLVIGMKCGGSDGFSGITANPLLGALTEAVICAGGTSLLTEVPEMFGAEEDLLNRCESQEVFEAGAGMIRDYKAYFVRHGQPVYENPSPGNKAGGITTLEEKSLGCTQKGGRAIVTDVLSMGEPVRKTGLNLVDGPGNDLCAVTNLACAGAQLVLFTTGRGTPLCGPVPTLKVATNGIMAARKAGWIDYNAGCLIEGKPMTEACRELLSLTLAVASGQKTRGEDRGYREIAIFKDGVTL